MNPPSEIITDAERPHHPTSPSSLALREECACYENQGGSNEAAERGTMQHAAVELGEDQDFLMDHEAIAVADCVAFCDGLIRDKYKGQIGHDLTEPYLPIDDRKILLDGVEFHGTTAGYCDRALVSIDEKFADIVDWKFGMFEVTDAEFNIQGMSYMLGLVRKFPKLERVTIHFVAPHRDEWSYHTFEKKDFKWIYNRVVRVVKTALLAKQEMAKDDWSRATPGESACLFCKHAAQCPALTQKCVEIGLKRKPLAFPADINHELVHDPKNAGVGLKLAAVVKKWAEAYRTFMGNQAIEQGDTVPEGYILVTSSRREIRSVRGIRDVAEKEFGLTEEEIDGASDIALGKLEKCVSAKAPRGTKGACEQQFKDALEEAGHVEKGSPFSFLKMAGGVKKNKPKEE